MIHYECKEDFKSVKGQEFLAGQTLPFFLYKKLTHNERAKFKMIKKDNGYIPPPKKRKEPRQINYGYGNGRTYSDSKAVHHNKNNNHKTKTIHKPISSGFSSDNILTNPALFVTIFGGTD